jgi:hypothetical protein
MLLRSHEDKTQLGHKETVRRVGGCIPNVQKREQRVQAGEPVSGWSTGCVWPGRGCALPASFWSSKPSKPIPTGARTQEERLQMVYL